MSLRRNHTNGGGAEHGEIDRPARRCPTTMSLRVAVVGEHRLPRVEVVRREAVAQHAELADAVEDLGDDVDADRRADRAGGGVGEGREERAEREQRGEAERDVDRGDPEPQRAACPCRAGSRAGQPGTVEPGRQRAPNSDDPARPTRPRRRGWCTPRSGRRRRSPWRRAAASRHGPHEQVAQVAPRGVAGDRVAGEDAGDHDEQEAAHHAQHRGGHDQTALLGETEQTLAVVAARRGRPR